MSYAVPIHHEITSSPHYTYLGEWVLMHPICAEVTSKHKKSDTIPYLFGPSYPEMGAGTDLSALSQVRI